MVRVYVAALTGFLALSASASATLQLTSVNESLADAYDSTAPARGKLRAYAATNVESDERAFSNLLEHLKTLNVLFSPLSKERMEAAISKSDSSVVKHLSEDGAVNEKKLGIGRDGVKAFEPAKVSKVKMILEDIFRKPYNKILLKVLSKANGGERNLVRNLAQAEMLGFKVFFLKSTLASKWERDGVSLMDVWSYICKDVNAPTEEEMKIFSHWCGYAFVLSAKGKFSAEETVIEKTLLKVHNDNKNKKGKLAINMLAQIHLSRKFKVDANFFELYDPSPSSLKKLLLELEKSPRAYDLDVELYRLLKQAVTDDKFMKGIWDRSTKKPHTFKQMRERFDRLLIRAMR